MWLSSDGFGLWKRNSSRRTFLKWGLLTAGAILFPSPTLASSRDPAPPERSLSFYHVHTGESLDTVYWCKGMYVSAALADINYILRDFHTEEIKSIDTRLLDLLSATHRRLDTREAFHIFSGYRSPATNALLRKQRRGVSKNSLHIHGKAADIYLPGIGISLLRRVAMSIRVGGVGYYPRNNFVHLDVGPVRYW